ncbi:PH, RCC1 and FYVE domains-containing protein 1 isoform X1 [Eucalyptus grandis]|uniref:PH, RCC1 and FYVE domains-containing protein 1 isoform X1 n=1 Tax=Eucalyptus grandis TaxID=71139 RepID=UPI00192EE6AA|nr:PH, RCC1 and FYVE domains-containing protein 1 isoform X1 [Eucalyptus grandis]
MADPQKSGLTTERDIEQAITALKKGAYLLKYGRRGKPKFCPFHLASDESTLIWYSGKEPKQVKLNQVSKIIPGQRTAIFQRYPRPEKEYQSFSLICSDRSLDLICKDKDEAEVWLVGLKALITRGNFRKWRSDTISETASAESPLARRNSPSITLLDPGHIYGIQPPLESTSQTRLGKVFSDIISYTAADTGYNRNEPIANSLNSVSPGGGDNWNGRNSGAETFRISLSSAVSSSSQGSCREDFESLGDAFIWGEGIGGGILGGGQQRFGSPYNTKTDAFLPKALESTVVLDVLNIACGYRHAVLVTRQGEIFSWGEELGGRLGHGIESDISHPKLIDSLSGMTIESVACGEYHTCAATLSGDLYTWGDGAHNVGLLGHGSEASHWIPRRVGGDLDGLHVTCIACGPWHTAVVTSTGQLFTFGDGSFGALGHGDRSRVSIPREVEALRGLRTTRVACGVWHTAAVVEVTTECASLDASTSPASGRLFTWGDGDKHRLGHGDQETRLIPKRVAALSGETICRVACGHSLTVALTASGRVFTMGSTAYGQLGNPLADGKALTCVEGKLADCFVEEIACGTYHVAALTSKGEVYTWGKGSNGQLGHGEYDNRSTPTLVGFLKDKQVKSVVCGSNFTAVICLHKWVSSIDHSMCSGCQNPFGFRRKRHNCYNCGLVFCKACSSRRSLKASLAPNLNKPYRVCDECYVKLKTTTESGPVLRIPKARTDTLRLKNNEVGEKDSSCSTSEGRLCRLLSADSLSLAESRHSIHDAKVGSRGSRVFPLLNRNFQPGGLNTTKEPILVGAPTKMFSFSVPGSRMPSRSASPLSRKSSPPRSSEVTTDDSKHSSDSQSQEIINLRAQVEDLTSKSRNLQSELEKTSKQLKQVTAIAEDEARRCKSAKEVIKSLTTQLKEMAERLPVGQRAQSSGSVIRELSGDPNLIHNENQSAKSNFLENESHFKSVNTTLFNGMKQQPEKAEWVVQDEPGVYISLASLPRGGNELRRIRFSRKQFTEEQAEKWWAANAAMVLERHNIQST